MNIKKILKELLNIDFWSSLFSIIKIKVFYEKENDISFYDNVNAHSKFSYLLIEKLIKQNKVILFVGSKEHELLNSNISNLQVYFIKNTCLLKLLNIPILITPATGYSSFCKPKGTKLIHLFHSIVSTHYIYGDGAFDAYDIFFAVGPHHIEELKRTEKIRNWSNKVYLETGYPKLESLVKYENNMNCSDTKTILFAPSWGEYNILKLFGLKIIKKVIELGYSIIVRPHPHSFSQDIETIDKIKQIAEENDSCKIENSNYDGMSSYISSDLMISDFSGAAYEYAFGLLKPVLFIDAPIKVANNSKEQLNYKPMEVTCRERIGVITDLDSFTDNLKKLISNGDNWKEDIKKVRKDFVFNPHNSIEIITNEIERIKNEN